MEFAFNPFHSPLPFLGCLHPCGIAKSEQSHTYTQAAALLLLSLLLAACNGIIWSNLSNIFRADVSAFLLTADGLRYGFISRPLAEPGTAREEGDPLSQVTFACLISHRCTNRFILGGCYFCRPLVVILTLQNGHCILIPHCFQRSSE